MKSNANHFFWHSMGVSWRRPHDKACHYHSFLNIYLQSGIESVTKLDSLLAFNLLLLNESWEAGCYWKGFRKRDGTTRRHPPSPVHQQGTVTSEFARKPSCLLWPGCQQRSKAWTNNLRSIMLWLILTVDIEIELLGRMSLQIVPLFVHLCPFHNNQHWVASLWPCLQHKHVTSRLKITTPGHRASATARVHSLLTLQSHSLPLSLSSLPTPSARRAACCCLMLVSGVCLQWNYCVKNELCWASALSELGGVPVTLPTRQGNIRMGDDMFSRYNHNNLSELLRLLLSLLHLGILFIYNCFARNILAILENGHNTQRIN